MLFLPSLTGLCSRPEIFNLNPQAYLAGPAFRGRPATLGMWRDCGKILMTVQPGNIKALETVCPAVLNRHKVSKFLTVAPG